MGANTAKLRAVRVYHVSAAIREMCIRDSLYRTSGPMVTNEGFSLYAIPIDADAGA